VTSFNRLATTNANSRTRSPKIRGHVDHIEAAHKHGQPIAADTAAWLSELSSIMAKKFAKTGLIEGPKTRALRITDRFGVLGASHSGSATQSRGARRSAVASRAAN
jgi:hypothetical protein